MYGGDGGEGQGAHVVVLTRQAEFHLRGRECVGVRGRSNGAWLSVHPALGAELRGCCPLAGGDLWPGALRAGAAAVLDREGGERFVSGEVFAIEHPRGEESERSLAAARAAGTPDARPASSGGRLLVLSAITGLLPWLAPRSD